MTTDEHQDDAAPVRNRRIARLAVVALTVTMLFVAYRFGVFAEMAEPRLLAQKLVAMGVWGYLVFILAYTALQPFGVPGTVFVFAAPLIWPWSTAFALSMVGTMGASVVGFSFVRFVARDWVVSHIPARFRKYDDALARNAFRTVVILRLIFWMPQALHAFLGVSKVRFWTHFWGSLVGYVLPLLAVSYFGSEMIDEAGHLRRPSWSLVAAFIAVTVFFAAVLRRLDPTPTQNAADDSSVRPS